eukprot:5780504-Pyramimonas_sp.AAC.1
MHYGSPTSSLGLVTIVVSFWQNPSFPCSGDPLPSGDRQPTRRAWRGGTERSESPRWPKMAQREPQRPQDGLQDSSR